MRILLANQWYPPESGWGGVATYNYVMAHTLAELGHRVTVVAAGANPTLQHTTDKRVTVLRLPARQVSPWNRVPLAGAHVRALLQMEYSWRLARVLGELYARDPFDVIEFAEINGEGYWFAKRAPAPVIVRCHTPTFLLQSYYHTLPFNPRLTNFMERSLIRRANVLTAPSHDLAARITQTLSPKQPIEVVPNPVDLDNASFSQAPMQDESDVTRVLFVGRFEYAKGIEVLAEAIPRVVRAFPTIEFVLCGYDRKTENGESNLARLRERLSAENVLAHAQILEGVEQNELELEYARADLCVVPSVVYESFSYTCAQAMAYGKPVIGSRIGGIPETVRDGIEGIIVPPGDDAALANAIVALAKNRALRLEMGKAARERVCEAFERHRVVKKMVRVYERAREQFTRAV
jgi:glycogen(starch) synthase